MPPIHIPVFRADLHVEIVPEEGLFLLSETEMILLNGPVYAEVGRLIDGLNSVDEIAFALSRQPGQVSMAEAFFVVENLAQKQLLVDRSQTQDETALFLGQSSDTKLPRTVCLTQLSAADDALQAALTRNGIAVVQETDAALHIVLVDSFADRRLAAINAAQIASGQPWMLAKLVGKIIWLGPVFVPGQTGCYACLAHRLRANREVESFLEKRDTTRDFLPLSKISLPSSRLLAAELVATEALRWLSMPSASPLQGAVVTLSLPSLEMQRHPLARRPQCRACGTPAALDAPLAPPVLFPHPKRFTEDGGHRSATPSETLAKYGVHISSVTGIVNDLSRLTPADDFIHSYHAGHNTANFYHNVLALQRGLRSKAGGKGKTDIQAKVSGLCEAIERYSGVFEGYEPRIQTSLTALGDQGIHPNACTHFSDSQYARQEEWNKYVGGFHTVPKPYNPDDTLEWSPVWSMTEQRVKYLPTAYLYFNYVHDKVNFVTWADSNGNASGNTLEEAILQGFFELVERDAVAIWWYNRLRMPAVDLASFGDPWIAQLLEQHRARHREVWVLDLTHDLGIPAFAALTRRTDKPVEDILVGFGAHFDPKMAVLRALTEINQFMPAVMDVSATGNAEYKFEDPHVLNWWKNATVANQPYLLPDPAKPARRAEDFPALATTNLLEDVLRCQAIVESKGMELILHDQTRPDIGMPVAKVIVPGMRHFWARLGPGRLFDVPVQMGWLPAPLAESELNPIPMFI